ncbi:MAG TPA: cytochrome P450 [Gammaproteobacteria bacterium]|nr:cytochrome P450 [Gammaproteobacteria bacterium]
MILDIRETEYRQNPYPTFKKMRAEAPICKIAPHHHWAIAKYADVQTILKNPQLFSSKIIANPPAEGPGALLFSCGLVTMDKPDHTRLRRLLSQAITPKIIRSLKPKIQGLCETLVQNLSNKTEVDFVSTFSMPLPIIVIAELLGIDSEKKTDFKRWANLLLTWRNQKSIAEIFHDVERMYYYFDDIIKARKRAPQTDLISHLVLASANETIITSEEILGLIRLLLVAGTETTTNLLGNAILALLAYPDNIERLVADPTLIPNFIEETLRYDGPALSLNRKATEDVELSGVKIRRGEIVLPLLASANHDEEIFEDPEHFDIERNTKGHIAFGANVHYCLGSQLARLQARTALEVFFKNIKHFQRVDNKPLVYLDSFFFRGPRSLPLKIWS